MSSATCCGSTRSGVGPSRSTASTVSPVGVLISSAAWRGDLHAAVGEDGVGRVMSSTVTSAAPMGSDAESGSGVEMPIGGRSR